MFNLAIDSKLGGCKLVKIRVNDAPSDASGSRWTTRLRWRSKWRSEDFPPLVGGCNGR